MFGNKQQDLEAVPVFSVETLSRAYEPVKVVMATVKWTKSHQHETALEELAVIGAREGCDAVIGVRFHTPTGTSIQNLYAYGTGIRYIDNK